MRFSARSLCPSSELPEAFPEEAAPGKIGGEIGALLQNPLPEKLAVSLLRRPVKALRKAPPRSGALIRRKIPAQRRRILSLPEQGILLLFLFLHKPEHDLRRKIKKRGAHSVLFAPKKRLVLRRVARKGVEQRPDRRGIAVGHDGEGRLQPRIREIGKQLIKIGGPLNQDELRLLLLQKLPDKMCPRRRQMPDAEGPDLSSSFLFSFSHNSPLRSLLNDSVPCTPGSLYATRNCFRCLSFSMIQRPALPVVCTPQEIALAVFASQ